MYKKEIFRKLDKKYNSHLYKGLLGILMRYCHRKLENFNKKNNHFNKVLEIGAGSAPHIDFLNHSFDEYHIAETSDYGIDYNDKNKNVIVAK